jgi:hypothetical protein
VIVTACVAFGWAVVSESPSNDGATFVGAAGGGGGGVRIGPGAEPWPPLFPHEATAAAPTATRAKRTDGERRVREL